MFKTNMKNSFLKTATLKDLQKELLGLLKIVDRVCRENSIEYWLDYGTLLGAVRHKGFIPWDDDIDVSVPASDYNRLISALNTELKSNKNIFLYPGYDLVQRFATTKILTLEGKKIVACVVDIAPARIINQFDKKNDRNISNVAEYFIYGNAVSGAKVDSKYIKNTLKDALIEKQKFTQYFHSTYLPSCNHRSSKSVVSAVANAVWDADTYFLYTDIFPLCEIDFEGSKFFAPNNFKNYLSVLYGDYMILPPKSEKTPKHTSKLYFCSSNQFALEITTAFIVKNNASFYRGPIRRFIKKIIKDKGWNKYNTPIN
jgi:lipopolysaccharide cholinephosphotransferase